MNAEIIAVGSELLLFGRHDGNGDWMALRLAALGVRVARRSIVQDEVGEIADAIGAARERSSLVLVTGGLGPTADDLTREGLARALGSPLRTDERVRHGLVARIEARGHRVLTSAERQARIPEGCEFLPNPVGSAPGLLHRGPPCWTVALPGVPGEMKAMFEIVAERLAGVLPGQPAPTHRFLIAGLPESEVDDRLRGLIGAHERAIVTILASEGGVELLVLGASSERDDSRMDVDRIAREIRGRLGTAVASEIQEPLAAAVGRRLRAAGATVAVAESCTGGLLGATMTSVPGSSSWFVGGFIVYSDALKSSILGVPSTLLDEHGAVSEPVARAMAEGARARTGSSYALALTGVAGPDGGTPEKPVGLVHAVLAREGGCEGLRLLLSGDRQAIRSRSVTAALDLLRRRLDEGTILEGDRE